MGYRNYSFHSKPEEKGKYKSGIPEEHLECQNQYNHPYKDGYVIKEKCRFTTTNAFDYTNEKQHATLRQTKFECKNGCWPLLGGKDDSDGYTNRPNEFETKDDSSGGRGSPYYDEFDWHGYSMPYSSYPPHGSMDKFNIAGLACRNNLKGLGIQSIYESSAQYDLDTDWWDDFPCQFQCLHYKLQDYCPYSSHGHPGDSYNTCQITDWFHNPEDYNNIFIPAFEECERECGINYEAACECICDGPFDHPNHPYYSDWSQFGGILTGYSDDQTPNITGMKRFFKPYISHGVHSNGDTYWNPHGLEANQTFVEDCLQPIDYGFDDVLNPYYWNMSVLSEGSAVYTTDCKWPCKLPFWSSCGSDYPAYHDIYVDLYKFEECVQRQVEENEACMGVFNCMFDNCYPHKGDGTGSWVAKGCNGGCNKYDNPGAWDVCEAACSRYNDYEWKPNLPKPLNPIDSPNIPK